MKYNFFKKLVVVLLSMAIIFPVNAAGSNTGRTSSSSTSRSSSSSYSRSSSSSSYRPYSSGGTISSSSSYRPYSSGGTISSSSSYRPYSSGGTISSSSSYRPSSSSSSKSSSVKSYSIDSTPPILYDSSSGGSTSNNDYTPAVSTTTSDFSSIFTDTKVGNTTTCGAVSFGTIESGQKTYGAIPKITRKPGGHYSVSMSFDAKIFFTYQIGEKCVFRQYQTGNTSSCKGESWLSGPYSQSAPVGWDSHPSTIILTDDTNNTSVKLKYVPVSSGSSPNGESGTTAHVEIDEGEYGGYVSGHGIDGFDDSNIREATDGSGDLYLEEPDGSVKEMYQTELKSDTNDGTTYTKTAKCTGDSLGSKCTCPEPNADTDKCITVGNGTETSSSCTANYSQEIDYDSPVPGKPGYYYMKDVLKDYSCSTTCSYTRSCKYIVHYVKVSGTVSGNTSGMYVIDEDDPHNSSKVIVGNRFQEIFEKFISIDASIGEHKYFLSSSEGFGTRACVLNIENDGIPDSWDNAIMYRTIDAGNNLNNVFAGRTPGKNWIKYFYNKNVFKYLKSSQVEPMYEIRLSASTMKKIAKSNKLRDFINWDLPTLMGDSKVYNPINVTGSTYSYNPDKDYWSTFEELVEKGAIITRNKETIIARNKELVSNGYNIYNFSLTNNNNNSNNSNSNVNIDITSDESIFRTGDGN